MSIPLSLTARGGVFCGLSLTLLLAFAALPEDSVSANGGEAGPVSGTERDEAELPWGGVATYNSDLQVTHVTPYTKEVNEWPYRAEWIAERAKTIEIVEKLETMGAQFRWFWLCGELRCVVRIHTGTESRSEWLGKPSDLRFLRDLSGLFGLSIGWVATPDEYLKAIEGNQRITFLALSEVFDGGSRFSAEELSPIETLSNLTTLFVGCPVDEPMCDAMRRAARATPLRFLSCRDLPRHLAEALEPEFEYIDAVGDKESLAQGSRILVRSSFYDDELWPFTSPPMYSRFFVRSRGWGPGMGVCAETRAISTDERSRQLMTFRWLEEIQDLQSVTLIDLDEPLDLPDQYDFTTVREAIIAVLPKLTTLETLNLDARDLSPELVEAIERIPNLKAIGITGGKINEEQFRLILSAVGADAGYSTQFGAERRRQKTGVVFFGKGVEISATRFAQLQRLTAELQSSSSGGYSRQTVLMVREP